MGVFRLMRLVHETPDRLTQAIALAMQARARAIDRAREGLGRLGPAGSEHLQVLPPERPPPSSLIDLGTFYMQFWNMKQAGELSTDETPAVWAVTMRAISVPVALRLFCETAVLDFQAYHRAWHVLSNWKNNLSAAPRAELLSKMRGQVLPELRSAAALRFAEGIPNVLDPMDADMFLQACAAALEAEREEHRRWLIDPGR